jgi:hypothetical protein
MNYIVYIDGKFSGIIDESFETFEEADEAGMAWVRQMESENPNDNLIYCYEVQKETE